MTVTESAALIGLDWGTSRLRAYLYAADGRVLATRDADSGILRLPAGGFPAALAAITDGWPSELPQLACGMVGSRQGWRETPYLRCPVDLRTLGDGLTAIEADPPGSSSSGPSGLAGTAGVPDARSAPRRPLLIPGASYRDPDGVPDVMRGEETQLSGALAQFPDATVCVLPGTHSKWALLDGDRLVRFMTFMSGELFALLIGHSILGRLIDGDAPDPQAFRLGVNRALRGGLPRTLFSARTLGLFGELPAASLHAYLSGLVIGAEIGAALDTLNAAGAPDDSLASPVLIGQPALAGHYATALAEAGVACRHAADAGATGLWQVATRAGLVPASVRGDCS